ncbi:Transcription regulator LexA [Acaryochloris thomasi RCC1774]|uniref:LexA repressor n=1 Tax=Acaryochloris thomasi RCC1774 TaxID=1764569 RepID=A0A2W1JE08_9CYAN|nr:transcriptional repressor LexA [Acaryochloris thomasi]PZD71948.1 Transcription regulator LexA [Acaryochloris thomasi RCC1774]
MASLTTVQRELFDWLVEYISQHQHSPSIRQMMEAMRLKSPAPVQSRLDHLRKKGYVDWEDGQARTLRIVHPDFVSSESVPVLGAIAAGGLIEAFTEADEHLDLSQSLFATNCYALRVNGDSMIDAHIADGDLVVMQPVNEPRNLKNGTIVAAQVEGEGTTLKRFYLKGQQITLEAANTAYEPIKVPAHRVSVQGSLVGVWRDYI